VRTPGTFVTDNLAPPDNWLPLQVVLPFAAVAITLAGLTFGTVSMVAWTHHRRAATRPQEIVEVRRAPAQRINVKDRCSPSYSDPSRCRSGRILYRIKHDISGTTGGRCRVPLPLPLPLPRGAGLRETEGSR
jgi:hypothetical protein